MIHRFGDCEFDSEAFELRRDGVAVETTPQALSILHYLLDNAGRLVTKAELIEAVWDGRAISDAAITVRLKVLREVLGDSGAEQRVVKTVRGKGLRFVAKVETRASAVRQIPASPDNPDPAPSRPPSVVIQPLRLVGEAGPHAMLAKALPDEIITALTKLRSLLVIARGSSFRYPSYTATPARLRTVLNVRYCLAGSMEIAGDRMTVSLELTDTGDDSIIWRDRQSVMVRDIHELRSEIVRQVASNVEQRITQREIESARLQSPSMLDSWAAYHRGLSLLQRLGGPQFERTRTFFKLATQLDPFFARPYAGMAINHYNQFHSDYGPDFELHSELARSEANHALEIDPQDPMGHYALSCGIRLLGEPEAAIAELERAVTLAPSYALAIADLGYMQASIGQTEVALRNIEEATRLNPRDPSPVRVVTAQLMAAVVDGDYERAANWAKKAEGIKYPTRPLLANALVASSLSGREDLERAAYERVTGGYPGGSSAPRPPSYYGLHPTLRDAMYEVFKKHRLTI